MNIHTYKVAIFIIISFLISSPLYAMHESGHDLSDEEWSTVKDRVELLDNINYMPTLLPTIIKNRDVLQLTNQQIKVFRDWRKQHYGNMVKTMNKIIEKRIDFKKAALNLEVSNDELFEMQNNILTMQRNLLKIKLNCRKTLVDTFTDEQWDNFVFVLSDHPKLASFLD